MALYMIGLGLGDQKDITLKGLEAVQKAKTVYLEAYTSALACTKEDLENLYKRKIQLADRVLVEQQADQILKEAKDHDVAFLVVGDVFSATTHLDLKLRAKEQNIPVKIIHNTSILTAVSILGLDLYRFGRTTTIPLENKNLASPADAIKENLKQGLHTLVLLDITPQKMMDVHEAFHYLTKHGFTSSQKCAVCCKLGSDDAEISFTTIGNHLKKQYRKYPQCIVIPGKLHFLEEEAVKEFEQ